MTVLRLLMAQTFGLQSMVNLSTATSSRSLDFVMKWDSPLELVILFGSMNGPYECGRWPDISIFRESLLSHLEPAERVEADDGYIGEHPLHIKCPAGFANPESTLFV